MSVSIRPWRGDTTGKVWEVDIRLELQDGTELRQRRRAPVSSKSGARRWGRDRERELMVQPQVKPRKEVPTLLEFAPRFIEEYVIANRQKPSEVESKKSRLRLHLMPHLGLKRLDAIRNEDVQRLKSRLGKYAPKTVNNVLTVLNRLLSIAVEWEVIDQMPCTIRHLKVVHKEAAFHDFAEYERLIDAAGTVGDEARLVVLLGGDAGLRRGEILALRWCDLDFERRHLNVSHSDWRGQISVPKGGRARRVPLTERLLASLQHYRHLRGSLVICEDNGEPLTKDVVQCLVKRAARLANLRETGIHILRHTFCSHLAMKGAPARAIQELAGHADLSTTQRYMHLSPRAVEDAIRLLEQPAPAQVFGEILEKGQSANRK